MQKINRKSFTIQAKSLDILSDLDDEQAGRLFKSIKSHLTRIALNPSNDTLNPSNNKWIKGGVTGCIITRKT